MEQYKSLNEQLAQKGKGADAETKKLKQDLKSAAGR